MGVKVLRSSEGDSVNRTGDAIFIGEVRARNLAEGSKDVTASVVQFAAGAQTKMHRHTSDQLLLVLSGIGKVGDTEHEHVIATGDSVMIDAGTDHWHGAGDTGSPMSHLSIQPGGASSTVLDA